MIKVTVDWIELKYALVRLTTRCIGAVAAICMVALSVAVSLCRGIIKGKDNDRLT